MLKVTTPKIKLKTANEKREGLILRHFQVWVVENDVLLMVSHFFKQSVPSLFKTITVIRSYKKDFFTKAINIIISVFDCK
jgi:hypothetical protein